MNLIIAAEAVQETAMYKLALGGKTLLIGLVMVFLILGILIGVVTLTRVIMNAVSKAKDNKKAKKVVATDVAKIEAPAPAPVTNNNDEIVAAISAAISMYYEVESASTGKSVKFTVRSIKQIR